MKKFSHQVSLLFLVFSLLVIMSSITSARIITPKLGVQGVREVKVEEAAKTDDLSHLMGLEEAEICEGQDCSAERRLLAEAHLDYIYTQKHRRP